MAIKVSPVSIPTADACAFVYVPVLFNNVAVSDVYDLSTLRVVGVLWDEANDIWGTGVSFNMAFEEAGDLFPVNKVADDGLSVIPYEIPTLLNGMTAIDIDTLAGVRFLQVVCGQQPGSVITGQLYLVLRELT